MGRISVLESVTLDGVMQGLGRPDEDTRGGFSHGGWGPAYADHVAGEFMGEGMANVKAMPYWTARAHLLGEAGQPEKAARCLERALDLTTNPQARRHLEARR